MIKISSLQQRLAKPILFLGLLLIQLAIFRFLGAIVIFPAAPPDDDGSILQLVKVAPPPLTIPPPPRSHQSPDLPSVPLVSGSNPSETVPLPVMPSTTWMPPLKPILFSRDMITRISHLGSSWGDSGPGNGDSGEGPDGANLSPEQKAEKELQKKAVSMLILEYAAHHKIEEARRWLAEGNDPNVWKPMPEASSPNYRLSPLYIAILGNQPDMVELLLDHGANPDPDPLLGGNYSGSIFFAVEYHCSPEIIKSLLEHGAKPDLRQTSDPAYAANPEWPHPRSQNTVLEAVHPLLSDENGVVTPEYQVKILKLLLEHGADPLRKDSQGYNALTMARGENRPDMVSVIEDFLKQPKSESKP